MINKQLLTIRTQVEFIIKIETNLIVLQQFSKYNRSMFYIKDDWLF